MKKLKSSGETIVEVLISIALVAGVLAGAYYLINRSYRQSQDAVERIAGIKAAESKVEILRTLSAASLASINSTKICLSESGALTTNLADPSCSVGSRYTVTVGKISNVYNVTAQWAGLLQKIESVTIYYKP